MNFSERLRVPAWWWVIVVLLVGSIAVAVFGYVPHAVSALVIGLLSISIILIIWGYGSLTITVDDHALQVGRFRLTGEWIAHAEVLDENQARDALGVHADVRNLLQTRPYVAGLVRVRLDDPADPHPAWLISSRRPDELADAVQHLAKRHA